MKDKGMERKRAHLFSLHRQPQSDVKKFKTMSDWPSPLGHGAAFLPALSHRYLHWSF
jgi:hypothetical protein